MELKKPHFTLVVAWFAKWSRPEGWNQSRVVHMLLELFVQIKKLDIISR